MLPLSILLHADSCEALSKFNSASVDAVLCDPPYPGIKRGYGFWTEQEWHTMMDVVVAECRRILKPTGSAIFILQPNSEVSGKVRPWVYEFTTKWMKEWNLVQDLYWWNYVSLPGGGATKSGLCRGTVKHMVWLGNPDCYRNQDAILWEESDESAARRASKRFNKEPDLHKSPSGYTRDRDKVHAAAARRGGVTPFNIFPVPEETPEHPNVFPVANNIQFTKHPASTPLKLCEKLIQYICPPGGLILDPFCGGANIGVASLQQKRYYIGVEKNEEMVKIAKENLEGYAKSVFSNYDNLDPYACPQEILQQIQKIAEEPPTKLPGL